MTVQLVRTTDVLADYLAANCSTPSFYLGVNDAIYICATQSDGMKMFFDLSTGASFQRIYARPLIEGEKVVITV